MLRQQQSDVIQDFGSLYLDSANLSHGSRSSFPSLPPRGVNDVMGSGQSFDQYNFADAKVAEALKQQSLPSVTRPSGAIQGPQEPEPPFLQPEVELQAKFADVVIALRASERAREEGHYETNALRRYLTEVEVAAAGLVSRVQELDHLLALSTASQEARDLDQLRDQMLKVTAREARQQAIAAAQAISTARQATMQLDQVKRDASALLTSQEEEIRRLIIEMNNFRQLLEGKDALLEERKKEEEKLMHQYKALQEDLNASKLEVSALKKEIEVMHKGAEQKAAHFDRLMQTLQFTRAAAHAAKRRLQEAHVEKKDISIQNELLKHEVADLQGMEVQATIAHYDHELCKVRAVLEGEKAHLLTELARLRRGNRDLRGELEEWRGKYKAILSSQGNCAGELISATYEPKAFASSKLREFFTRDSRVQQGSYLLLDGAGGNLHGNSSPGGSAIVGERASQFETQGQVVQDEEKELHVLARRDGPEIRGRDVHFSDGRDHEDDQISMSDGKELRLSDIRNSQDGELRLLEITESLGNGQRCSAERSYFEFHGSQICSSDRVQPNHELQASNLQPCDYEPVECRANFSDFKSGSWDNQSIRKKMRSVVFVDQPICRQDGAASTVHEDNCFEMGENLLAVAHTEICKLKRGKRGDHGRVPFAASLRLFGPIIFFLLRVVTQQASERKKTSSERDINDIIYEGLQFLERRYELN